MSNFWTLRQKTLTNQPTHLFNRSHDRLFMNRPSFIPSFSLRMRNIISNTSLATGKIHMRSCFNCPPWQSYNIKTLNIFSSFNKNNTSDLIYHQLFSFHREEYADYIEIYTDGSKAVNGVGCSYVCGNVTSSYSLSALCLSFTAEIIAIKQALLYINTQRNKKYIIYTDLTRCFINPNTSNSLIYTIVNTHKQLSQNGYSILFCWVPGHAGIHGNELADMAAKRALNPLNHDIPNTDMILEVKRLCLLKLQALWIDQTNNKLHSIKKTVITWPCLHRRRLDVLMTRLRIGHSRLTHRHLLFGEDTPECCYCHCPLTIHHILTSCAFTHLYIKFFKMTSPSLETILGESPHPAIFSFLKTIGIFHHI